MNLDKLRDLCMSMPDATEGVKWEDHICFMVAEKMFCITGEFGGASIKVTPEDFEELTERDGIVPTPYMARNMWVSIQEFNKLKPGNGSITYASLMSSFAPNSLKRRNGSWAADQVSFYSTF